MLKNTIALVLFSALCGCTDNSQPKEKPNPVVYPPVQYSLADTVPQKPENPATAENEADSVYAPKIVHKALCRYTKLSEEFDFALAVDMDTAGNEVPVRIYLKVISKANGETLQTLIIEEPDMIYNAFDCVGRSYSTGHNADELIVDDNSGDIVVADLNFDEKEDFGLAKNNGFHVYYHFYLQDENGNFEFNKYLTTNLMGFPNKIDSIGQTIETLNRWSYHGVVYNTFKYNKTTGKYKEIRRQGFGGEKNELLMDWLNGVDNMKH